MTYRQPPTNSQHKAGALSPISKETNSANDLRNLEVDFSAVQPPNENAA